MQFIRGHFKMDCHVQWRIQGGGGTGHVAYIIYCLSVPNICMFCTRACLQASHIVAYSLIVPRIYYALPAWGRFLSADLTGKINALFRRLVRFDYLSNNLTVSDLLGKADNDMFHDMCKSHHCLHHLLPSSPRTQSCHVAYIIYCLSVPNICMFCTYCIRSSDNLPVVIHITSQNIIPAFTSCHALYE